MKKILQNDLYTIIAAVVLFVSGCICSAAMCELAARILFLLAAAIAGIPVLMSAARGLRRRDFLDEKFLMSIACIGAIAIGEYTEAAGVMIFYQIGEHFQDKAVAHSRRSIRSLMDICPDTATVIRNGEELTVDADEVEVGETVVIRTGERIPIDVRVLEGTAELDTSALTGESVPRSVAVGDSAASGSVVLMGVLRAEAIRPSDESAAARILQLVENASDRKAKEEEFITKFARVYTPIVVSLAFLLTVIPPIFGWMPILQSLRRALIFLVISCPCALVISVPMAFFGGIGGAASRGILYKGGNTFSPLARVHTVAFDKTGTLTTGEFSVRAIHPVGIESSALLRYAASAEYGSNHPLALCLRAACSDCVRPTSVREIAGRGIVSVVEGRRVSIGNQALMRDENIVDLPTSSDAYAVLFVAIDRVFSGTILLSDTVKSEAAASLKGLRRRGVSRVVMISGDRAPIAERVGAELGLDSVFAEQLPEQKFTCLEHLIADANGPVMYVGDGINDAPSIARADVGVAMGKAGQDSAIEAADVVIMSDDLSRLPTAIGIAKKTLRIARENIVFALGIKVTVLVLGALGIAGMGLAVFADVGVAVLAILNAMRALHVKDK